MMPSSMRGLGTAKKLRRVRREDMGYLAVDVRVWVQAGGGSAPERGGADWRPPGTLYARVGQLAARNGQLAGG